MVRFAHVLKPNRGKELPVHSVFYDTETTQIPVGDGLIKHVFKLGIGCYLRRRGLEFSEEWFTFRDPREFWDWVNSHLYKNSKLYLFAHNQHFDFFVVKGLENLHRLGFKLKAWWVDSHSFIMKWKNEEHRRTLWILDTGNYFQSSVADLGKVLGLPKLVINFATCTDKELETYCRRDVEIIKEAMKWFWRFIREHDLGNFSPTLAGQAFVAYRHRFMPCEIFIHNNRKALDLEVASYRGGRTECFRIGKFTGEVFRYVDVNGLYPYVMREHEFPVKLITYQENPVWEITPELLEKYDMILEALIELGQPAIGVRKQKLIFPVGRFWAFLCTPEIAYVLEHGKILKIKRGAVYEKRKLFDKWVDEMAALKAHFEAEGNTVFRHFTKLLLNSLYGKFGQRQQTKVFETRGVFEDGIQDYVNEETGEHGFFVTLNGETWRVISKEQPALNAFPAIASMVTAYGRMMVWDLICKAGIENVFYCDTDGLIVNEKGYENLKHLVKENTLGALSVKMTAETIEIKNLKHYTFGPVIKIKGIKPNASQIDELRFRQEQFYKFRSALRKRLTDTAYSYEVIKEISLEYDKGSVDANGKVHPPQLVED